MKNSFAKLVSSRKSSLLLFKIISSLVFVCFLALLVVLIYADKIAHSQATVHINNLANPIPTPADYPVLKTIKNPNITAQGAIIEDADSQVIVYGKNINEVLPTASSTKIMTALVALDYYQPDQVLTDQTFPVEGSIAGLKLGEKMTFSQALYGLLLPSGNDVAVMMAQNYPGGMPNFLAKMNEKAKQLHLDNTYYADVDGIDSANVTTVQDLERLSVYAMKNPTFAQVVDTKNQTITDVSGTIVHKLSNLNKLLGTEGINGIKTGYTGDAGGVLVTSKMEQGHMFIIVVLKSDDRFLDTQKLLQLVNNNVTFVAMHP